MLQLLTFMKSHQGFLFSPQSYAQTLCYCWPRKRVWSKARHSDGGLDLRVHSLARTSVYFVAFVRLTVRSSGMSLSCGVVSYRGVLFRWPPLPLLLLLLFKHTFGSLFIFWALENTYKNTTFSSDVETSLFCTEYLNLNQKLKWYCTPN